jgi:deoxyribonuclease-4
LPNPNQVSTNKGRRHQVQNTTINFEIEIDDLIYPNRNHFQMEKERVTPLIGCGLDSTGITPIQMLEMAHSAKLPIVQFFNGEVDRYTRKKLDPRTAKEALVFMQTQGVRAFAHCPFCINLAKDPLEDNKSIKCLHSDIDALGRCGISCVTHIGHHLKKGYTMQSVCRTLSCLDFWGAPGAFPLLLENAAGDGTEMGVTWEEMRYLAQNTDPHVGFCIDTQHAFAGMRPDLQTVDGVNQFFKDIDASVGLNRVKLFHLNDSLWAPGSVGGRKDSHAASCRGQIWGNDESHRLGLKHLIFRGDPGFLYSLIR